MKQGLFFGVLGLIAVVAIGVATVYFWPTSGPAPAGQSTPQMASRAVAPQASQPTAPSSSLPDFDVVRVRPDGQTVIAGRADPGATVTVLDGEKVVASATADAHGEWVVLPDKALTPGSHELSLTEKSPSDGTDRKSANVVVIAVPEPKKSSAGEASQPLAVLVPRQGEGVAKTLQAPSSAPPAGAPYSGAAPQIGAVQYDSAGHLSVSGRAAPDQRVLLYIENRPVGDTRADAKGDWSVQPSETVAAGNYSMRVDSMGKDDKVTARAQLQFRRVEVPKELAGNKFLIVQPGDTLWHIARRTYGEGILFTDIYHANRNEIIDPNLIYPGQVVSLPPG
jgi:nucleoid-associated protein YgaU